MGTTGPSQKRIRAFFEWVCFSSTRLTVTVSLSNIALGIFSSQDYSTAGLMVEGLQIGHRLITC
jgi:hypothetical protein